MVSNGLYTKKALFLPRMVLIEIPLDALSTKMSWTYKPDNWGYFDMKAEVAMDKLHTNKGNNTIAGYVK